MASYSGTQMVKPIRRAVVVGGGFIRLEAFLHSLTRAFVVLMIRSRVAPGDAGRQLF